MSVKINYLKNSSPKSSANLVLFTNEKFNTNNLKTKFSKSEFVYISDIIRTNDLKKNLLVFEINSKKKVILISVKEKLKTSDIENLGAEFYGKINQGKSSKEYFVISDTITSKYNNLLGHFLHGIKLKSYEFNKYKSKKENKTFTLNIVGHKNIPTTFKLLP